jgi:hypothetical protein
MAFGRARSGTPKNPAQRAKPVGKIATSTAVAGKMKRRNRRLKPKTKDRARLIIQNARR